MNPEDFLEGNKKILLSKRHDYTSGDIWENFHRSAAIAEWFGIDRDKAYVILIGTKLARLATLLSNDKYPLNESIEDSFRDLTNYCALWATDVITGRMLDTSRLGEVNHTVQSLSDKKKVPQEWERLAAEAAAKNQTLFSDKCNEAIKSDIDYDDHDAHYQLIKRVREAEAKSDKVYSSDGKDLPSEAEPNEPEIRITDCWFCKRAINPSGAVVLNAYKVQAHVGCVNGATFQDMMKYQCETNA
jgi:hypothetical protein